MIYPKCKELSKSDESAVLAEYQSPGLRPGSGDGFCLERFQGGPASLESADPLLDVGGDMLKSEAIRHKARKAMLQRLPGPDVLMYFVDLQKLSSSTPGESAIMTEKLLSQAKDDDDDDDDDRDNQPGQVGVHYLAHLLWMVAPKFCVDLADMLARLDAFFGKQVYVPPQATVKLFGWGQANLTTPEQHQALPPAERRERAGKWREFISSIDKVGWEAARAYRHRFNNAAGWTEVKFVVADFDALSNADFIGQVSIHLDKASSLAGHEQVLHLVDRSGNPVIGKNGLPATLTCAIQFHPLPEGRLSAVWRVHVLSAANLPSRDLSGSSDPWVSLYATGKEGSQAFCFQQRSSVLPRNLDPQWDEMFELPVARPGEQFLAEALEEAAPGLGAAVTQSAEKILPCAVGSGLIAAATGVKEEKAAFSAWSIAAAHAADRAARGLARGGRSPVAPAAGVTEGDGTVEPIFSDGLRSLPDRSACTGWSLLGTCQ
ncbi:Synaptotagmin-3 [Symbiodinium microadriaticum]|uniref:Synaptotagmin-3 n=1 Tax=Symbiodinium microadriaticum TaxID=2951 RepID=A0A1Q9F6X6_SYMMI|nr:Synaptotagmin-3 [Symbiodinium microadriaticum]